MSIEQLRLNIDLSTCGYVKIAYRRGVVKCIVVIDPQLDLAEVAAGFTFPDTELAEDDTDTVFIRAYTEQLIEQGQMHFMVPRILPELQKEVRFKSLKMFDEFPDGANCSVILAPPCYIIQLVD